MRRKVMLTESDLRRIVNKSVRRVLREMDDSSEQRAIDAARNAATAAASPCICPYPEGYDPDRYKNMPSRRLSPEEEDEYVKRSQRRVKKAARDAAMNAEKLSSMW